MATTIRTPSIVGVVLVVFVACSSGSTSRDSGPGGSGGQAGATADASGDSAGGDAAAGAGGGGQGGQGGQTPDAGAGAGGQGGGEPTCVLPFHSCSTFTPPCCSGSMCSPSGTCMLIQVSDRNAKRDFAQVNNDEILEALARLPISTWSYKSEDPHARHIGPMAQDFMATFHVGATDKAIFQVDGDGVAFAAIQALNERVKRLTEENATLRRELSQIRSDLARDRRPRARASRGGAPR
jgi:hypothetical protein